MSYHFGTNLYPSHLKRPNNIGLSLNYIINPTENTSLSFQSLYPIIWKHPAHTLLPFVNLHSQEAFEHG
jgi:hypothetical protein